MNYLKIISLIFVGLILQACSDDNIWHEKITVVVNTPQGKVESNSVHRTGFSSGGFVFGSPDRRFLQGEAVVVELSDENGNSRYMFALLKGFSSYYQFHRKAFRAGEKYPKDFLGKPPRALPVKSYPLLVTFEDIKKPETVKHVKPEEFEAVFGEGYSINEITVQVTDEEKVAGEVERILGWYSGYPEPSVLPNLDPENYSIEAKLRHGNFIRK